ncbi:DUF2529 family protein [Guptibacillus hwajinpoensis]|uniref:DUF2529 family protein n=1 Tax=Guptibacillus hwajinpoensis TaxID=208199 RepID=UPI001CD371D0|nr:DUF2529 family protein [Pseudalkalibacillus hwajinpoensis]MCA0991198.1 DUF2529 domain-containing protein [Pseudalkalibacillus hwajinpoensis]
MLKIFTTQLMGKFKGIQDQHEMIIEDISRLFAQIITGGGTVYFYGENELQGAALEAVYGSEKLPSSAILHDPADLTENDCVLLFSRLSEDEAAAKHAETFKATGATVVGISATRKEADPILEQNTDFHINTGLTTGLVPNDEGERIGYPALLTSLYVYHALYLTTREILEEHGYEF